MPAVPLSARRIAARGLAAGCADVAHAIEVKCTTPKEWRNRRLPGALSSSRSATDHSLRLPSQPQ